MLGVGPDAEDALAMLDVTTIFDLSQSRLFAAAADLALVDGGGPQHVYGRPAADAVDGAQEATDTARLADADIEVLAGVGERNGPQIKAALHVRTVRDLALWPPYQAAREIAARVLTPGSGVSTEDVPPDLLPKSGEYPTERVFYQSLLLGEVLSGRDNSSKLKSKPAARQSDIAEAGPFDPLAAVTAGTGFARPAIGAALNFSQSWYTQGVTLGQLLHSVALAPGESTRIAMIDWSRQTTGQQVSTDEQSEELTHTLGRNRAISEVVNSVATETQAGSSETNVRSSSETLGVTAAGGGTGFGVSANYGLSSTTGRSWGHSTSMGQRNIGAAMTQNVVDRTHQAANVARNRRASIVREVSEQESEVISTRLVANYNHMHALSVQYYEVVQAYRVLTRLERVDRCLFLPMKLVDFTDARLLPRIRSVLASAALHPRIAHDLVAGIDTVVLRCAATKPGHGFTEESTVPAEQMAGRKIRLAADSLAFPPGTGFWFGSASPDVRVTRVEGVRHVGDRKMLVYPHPLQEGADYHADGWPIEPVPNMPPNFPVAEMSQFKSLRVHIAPMEGQWEAGGVHDLSVTFCLPSERALSSRSITVRSRHDRPAGSAAVVDLELSGGALATGALLDHLRDNAYHYSQAVWQSLDAAVLASMLDGYSMKGQALTNLLDFRPLGTTGNYLVFRLAGGEDDPAWQQWLTKHGIQVGEAETSVVPLPSGGVFAEAVLGRSNSAEKIDLTRFWDWQVSPPPLAAPEIAPVAAGSRHQDEPLEHLAGAQPTLNIVSAPNAPDPVALGAAMAALGNGALFRDMSAAQMMGRLTEQATTQSLAAAVAASAMASKRNPTELGGLANLGREMDDRAKLERQNQNQKQAGAAGGRPAATNLATEVGPPANMERSLVFGGAGAIHGMQAAVTPVVYDKEDVDAVGTYGPHYADLLAFKVPPGVRTSLTNRDMAIHRFDEAIGDLNLDFYAVTVTTMPTVDGVQLDAQALFEHLRLNIAEFVDKGNSEFSPYSDDDATRWGSDDPLGAVFKIDIVGPDNAAVVASHIAPNRWRFTTVSTPETGGHPVSGHREWGYRVNEDGACVFYTRGADRSTRAAETLASWITFGGADRLWLSFQDRLAKFVNSHDGVAVKNDRFSEQFEWTPFRQLMPLPLQI
jgi:hypothetical protein